MCSCLQEAIGLLGVDVIELAVEPHALLEVAADRTRTFLPNRSPNAPGKTRSVVRARPTPSYLWNDEFRHTAVNMRLLFRPTFVTRCEIPQMLKTVLPTQSCLVTR